MKIFKVEEMETIRLDVLITYKELTQINDYMAIWATTKLEGKEVPIRIFKEVPGHENENY